MCVAFTSYSMPLTSYSCSCFIYSNLTWHFIKFTLHMDTSSWRCSKLYMLSLMWSKCVILLSYVTSCSCFLHFWSLNCSIQAQPPCMACCSLDYDRWPGPHLTADRNRSQQTGTRWTLCLTSWLLRDVLLGLTFFNVLFYIDLCSYNAVE